jgi:hypothetical protein
MSNLLWGTKNPAVVLTNQGFNLKRMFHVKFADGAIDTSSTGVDGDPEPDGMYLYIYCKTFLTNEAIKIIYTDIDGVQRTIPSTGSYSLSARKEGEIIRVISTIASGSGGYKKAKKIDEVQLASGGRTGQEIQIWGIDQDLEFIGLPLPVPFQPDFDRVEKLQTLAVGWEDSKLIGFRLVATLTYDRLKPDEAKRFVPIFNSSTHFYFLPYFYQTPQNKYLCRWHNRWHFENFLNQKEKYKVPEIIFRGVELIQELPKPLEEVFDHTGYWSPKDAGTENDHARFWNLGTPWVSQDLIFSEKRAFEIKYTGSGTECRLYISRTHLATYVDDVLDLLYQFSNVSYDVISELVAVIDGDSDYVCTAEANQTDFDATTEKHYDGTQASKLLIPVNDDSENKLVTSGTNPMNNIKNQFFLVFW